MNIIFSWILFLEGILNLYFAYCFAKHSEIKRLVTKQKNLWLRNVVGGSLSTAIGGMLLWRMYNSYFSYKSDIEVIGMYLILGGILLFGAICNISTDDTPEDGLNFREYYKKAGMYSAYILIGGAVIAFLINLIV